MNCQEQVSVLFPGNGHPVFQADKTIIAAGHHDFIFAGGQQRFSQNVGEGQDHVFFLRAGPAYGARINAAMARIEDDDFLAALVRQDDFFPGAGGANGSADRAAMSF